MFAFSSLAIGDAEAFEIIRKARADHPVQMPELKASKLVATERGQKLITALLTAIDGRYVVSVNDKLLALCGWFFEYIYEPVYQDNPRLLYEKNFHRFVAMYTWLWMTDPTSDAKRAIEQFQKYMRSRDPADAPFLFNNPRPPLSEKGTEHPFESILRFAYGYRDIITADNANLNTLPPTPVAGCSISPQRDCGVISITGAVPENCYLCGAIQASRFRRSLRNSPATITTQESVERA